MLPFHMGKYGQKKTCSRTSCAVGFDALRLYFSMMLYPNVTQPPARPLVPLAPVLSRASFGRARAAAAPGVLTAGASRLVTSGRIAIALALREMGVGAGDTVLLPAYHSLSMVPPVLWRGAIPRFYRVGTRAEVDLDDVESLLDPTVKVLVVTNYFGFPQDLRAIRGFCDARGLLLLEDCAHCFFGEYDGLSVGSFGDYAIASSMKFFPVYEGGCLISARHPLTGVTLRSAGAGFEAKALLATLENSFAYGRLPRLRAALAPLLGLKNALWRMVKARVRAAPALAPGSSDSDASFDPHWLDKRSSRFTRSMLRRVSGARIVALRRRNYLRLEQALGQRSGCRPLFARLPDGVCPWLFPLQVDDADAVFVRLRQAGVPLVRFAETLWAGVDAERCANSIALSRHILSFPCHQELDDAELDWMIDSILKVLPP
jgi:perosamine synthetase